jgi:hypothetical protein
VKVFLAVSVAKGERMMRYPRWKGILFVIIGISIMLFGVGCEPEELAAQIAVRIVADQLMTEEPTDFLPNTKPPGQMETQTSDGLNTEETSVFSPTQMLSSTGTPVPTDTPPPTSTPTPTDTPVPTPTEMKAFMEDEEGDCEVLEGSMGDGGCPVDLSTLGVFPCESPGLYTFTVQFYGIRDINTTDVCFLINGDGDPDTGLTDHPLFGVDWVYCWSGQEKGVFLDTFDKGGNYVTTITVSDPFAYVLLDAVGENVSIDPFQMAFPPAEFAETAIASSIDISVDATYFSSGGDMVWDRVNSVNVATCPTQ